MTIIDARSLTPPADVPDMGVGCGELIRHTSPWGDVTPEEDARLTHQMKHGPCFECGATSPDDATGKCNCAGDKDHCHGCDLWPDA